MPRCSVIVCKNNSCIVNYKKDSISFHTYPKDPKIKEMWINATGRGPSWFPTKNHTICSSHFEPKCFQPLKKVRRLFEWSVPTLKLRMVLMNYMEPSTSKVCFYSELDKKDPNLVKSVCTFEGNTLKQVQKAPDGLEVTYVREFGPEEMKAVMTAKDVTCTRVYKVQ